MEQREETRTYHEGRPKPFLSHTCYVTFISTVRAEFKCEDAISHHRTDKNDVE